MPNEPLQERAALYASGLMTPEERGQFELVLEFHDELRALVSGLAEVGAALSLAALPPDRAQLSPGLKARILDTVKDRPQQTASEALVMSGPDGLVRWINPAFSEMCGYTLEELHGKKLGPILQGEKTDLQTADRMRRAVREHRPCNETILNYHKNGSPYWVEIDITPVLDDAGQPLWLVAREREMAGGAAAQ